MVNDNTRVLVNDKNVKYLNFTISKEGGRIIDEAVITLPVTGSVEQWSKVEIVQAKNTLTEQVGFYPLNGILSNEYGNTNMADYLSGKIEYLSGHFGRTLYLTNDNRPNIFGYRVPSNITIEHIDTTKHFDICFWIMLNDLSGSNNDINTGIRMEYAEIIGLGKRQVDVFNIKFSSNNNNDKITDIYITAENVNRTHPIIINNKHWNFVRFYSVTNNLNTNNKNIIMEFNGQNFLITTTNKKYANTTLSIFGFGNHGISNDNTETNIGNDDVKGQTLSLWGKYLLNGNLNDTSGNSRNLVANGGAVSYVSGKFNNALRSNTSANANVTTPTWERNGDWDIVMWYKTTGNYANWAFEKQDQNVVDLNSSQPRIYLYNDGGWTNLTGITRPANNTWVFVQMKYDYTSGVRGTLTVNVGNQTWTRQNTHSGSVGGNSRLYLPSRIGQNHYDNIAIKVGSLFTDDEVAEIKNNFTPVDTTKPTLSSAVYTTGNGVITLTFSENIKTVDRTKFAFTAGNATMSLPVATINGNVITATFASGNQSILNGAASITLSIDSGAVTDNADNNIDASSDIAVTKQDTKRPTLLNTSFYTRLTGVITLNFSENISSITTQNIIIRDNNFTAVNLPSVKIISNNVVTVTLSATDRTKFNNSDSITISIPANTASDVSGNMNVAITNMDLNIVGNKIDPPPNEKDIPKLTSGHYYNKQGILELYFNNNIKKIDINNISLQYWLSSHTFPVYNLKGSYTIFKNRVLITVNKNIVDQLNLEIGSALSLTLREINRIRLNISKDSITSDKDIGNRALANERLSLNNYKVPYIIAKYEEKNHVGLYVKNVRIKNNSYFTRDELIYFTNYLEPTSLLKFGGRVHKIVRELDKTILYCQSYGAELAKTDSYTVANNDSPENIIEQAISQNTKSLRFVNSGGLSNVTIGDYKNRGKLIETIRQLSQIGKYEFTTDPLGNFILYRGNRRIFPSPLIHGQRGISITKDILNDQTFKNIVQGTIPVTQNAKSKTYHTKISPYGILAYNPAGTGSEIPSTITLTDTPSSVDRIYTRWSVAGLINITTGSASPSSQSGVKYLTSSQYSVTNNIVTITNSGRIALMVDRINQTQLPGVNYVDMRVDLYIDYKTPSTLDIDVKGITQKGHINIQSAITSPSFLSEMDMIQNVETSLLDSIEIKKSVMVKIAYTNSPFDIGDVVCLVNDIKGINNNYIIRSLKYDYMNNETVLICNEYEYSSIDDRDKTVTRIDELGNSLNETFFIRPTFSLSTDTINVDDSITLEKISGTQIPAIYGKGKYSQSRYGVKGTSNIKRKGIYGLSSSTYGGVTVY